MIRFLADDHLSHKFIAGCQKLVADFPIVHIADWQSGAHRTSKDPVLLQALQAQNLILISCDRRTMAMHAAQLTRTGSGHSGVILFRRNVSQMDYGKQSCLLAEFWREAADWDWLDRIQYLPR